MTNLCRLRITLVLLALPGVGCAPDDAVGPPSFGSQGDGDDHSSDGDGDGDDGDGDGDEDPSDDEEPTGDGDRVDSGKPPSSDASTDDDDAGSPPNDDDDASTPDPEDAGPNPQPKKKFVGNITTRGQVRSDFKSFWNQITPENEGKWGTVEATRNQMNWAGVDRAYKYAKDNGLIFKQHTFVWGSQQPSWLAGLSASQQRAEVEEWIRLYCERYPDTQMIDVVNEPPPHTNPVYANALGGAGASGYDWIVQSFKWARQYCPKAILILNDYNTIEYTADSTRFIDIVKKIKAANAPIDAVGAQAHDAYKHPTATVKAFIDKLASETGLPVYISEYDINEANQTKQADIMKSQFTMFWNHSAVKGITIWGYVQGATWLPNTGLMSESGQQKPAMKWLVDFLEQQ